MQRIGQALQLSRSVGTFRDVEVAAPRHRRVQSADDRDVAHGDQGEQDHRVGKAEFLEPRGKSRRHEKAPCRERGHHQRKQSAFRSAQECREDHRRVEGDEWHVEDQRAERQPHQRGRADQDDRRKIGGPGTRPQSRRVDAQLVEMKQRSNLCAYGDERAFDDAIPLPCACRGRRKGGVPAPLALG